MGARAVTRLVLMPSAAELALGLVLVLIVAAGLAAAVALLAPPAAAAAPVISLTEINDVIAGAIRITREAAQ